MGRKACSSTTMTSTPYKPQLVEAKEAKEVEQQSRDSYLKTQELSRPETLFSRRTFRKKGKELVMKHLNLEKKNVEELSTEDKDSVPSGTSDLGFLLTVSPSKDNNAWSMFWNIIKANFGLCALRACCEHMWIMLKLNVTCISAIYVAKRFYILFLLN